MDQCNTLARAVVKLDGLCPLKALAGQADWQRVRWQLSQLFEQGEKVHVAIDFSQTLAVKSDEYLTEYLYWFVIVSTVSIDDCAHSYPIILFQSVGETNVDIFDKTAEGQNQVMIIGGEQAKRWDQAVCYCFGSEHLIDDVKVAFAPDFVEPILQ